MIDLGRKVKILYTARFEDGTILDSSDHHNGQPLEFVIGSHQVIPGLEKAVVGMSAFEKKTVVIPAAEAYGEYDESLVEEVSVDEFPDAEKLPVGEYIMLSLPDKKVRARVAGVDNGLVRFDFNHEYANCDVTFDIELVEIFGETGSAVENEQHASDCGCGCQKLKNSSLCNKEIINH